jgi:galactokinase
VSRDLAASKYNERRRECNAAVDALQAVDDDIETLRDVSPAFLEAHADALSEPLGRRARHVVTENQRVQQGADRLADGDVAAFGHLMSASHTSLRDDYAVSSDELDTLVDAAEATNGVFGARMTGAGFGGCVVALARSDALETLAARAQAAHEDRFGHTPAVYVVEENLQAGVLAAPSADA